MSELTFVAEKKRSAITKFCIGTYKNIEKVLFPHKLENKLSSHLEKSYNNKSDIKSEMLEVQQKMGELEKKLKEANKLTPREKANLRSMINAQLESLQHHHNLLMIEYQGEDKQCKIIRNSYLAAKRINVSHRTLKSLDKGADVISKDLEKVNFGQVKSISKKVNVLCPKTHKLYDAVLNSQTKVEDMAIIESDANHSISDQDRDSEYYEESFDEFYENGKNIGGQHYQRFNNNFCGAFADEELLTKKITKTFPNEDHSVKVELNNGKKKSLTDKKEF